MWLSPVRTRAFYISRCICLILQNDRYDSVTYSFFFTLCHHLHTPPCMSMISLRPTGLGGFSHPRSTLLSRYPIFIQNTNISTLEHFWSWTSPLETLLVDFEDPTDCTQLCIPTHSQLSSHLQRSVQHWMLQTEIYYCHSSERTATLTFIAPISEYRTGLSYFHCIPVILPHVTYRRRHALFATTHSSHGPLTLRAVSIVHRTMKQTGH